MSKIYNVLLLMAILIIGSNVVFVRSIEAAPQYKVLVVMSYEDSFLWCQEIKEGIDSEIGSISEIKYFYMDTKTNLADGLQKSKEAYELYKEYQPDGVITVDDNAQSMFVVPYLKDQVEIPVMFCGVNAAPEKYGYPASNVSGILERGHIRESIVFAQELVPSIKTVAFMMKDSPTGKVVVETIQKETDTYTAKVVSFNIPKTLEEAVKMAEDLKGQCDALFFETMEQLPTKDGTLLTEGQAISIVAEKFGKPTISDYEGRLKGGTLCAVVKSGQEQGTTAANMLLEAMKGKPVSEIPITKNQYGRRIIDVDAMKTLNIKPSPQVLRSAEFRKN